MKSKLSTIAISISLAMLWATPAHATDLLQAYRMAQDSDPTFASARYTLDAARQKIPQARASLLPSASATANDGNTRADTAFTDVPPVDRNMKAWGWNLQLTQPLLRLGTVYAYRESSYLVEQAEAQFEQAKQDLLLRVAQAYFGVIVAQDAIAAADAQVAALTQQLAQVTRGFQQGTHAQTDIDDTKSRLGSAKSQRVGAQNDLENARADLEKVTGKPYDQGTEQLAILQPTLTPPPPSPADSRAWIAQARTNHPLVRA